MEVESANKSRRSSVNKDAAPASGKKSKKSKNPTPVAVAVEVEEVKKKATPQKKTPVVVEGFFLLDNIKSHEGTSAQAESKDSLSTVLNQALQNNDVQLFDSCFENEDNDAIDNTVKKLAQNKVLVLLEKLGERIAHGKKSNYNFSAWLSAIVRNHSTFLLKLPELANKIAPLVALLQKRTLAIDQVHRLKGKIDMVLDIETEVTRPKKAQKKTAAGESLITYEENDGVKQVKKAKGGKKQGYTKAMEELEDIEGEEDEGEFEEEEGEEDSENDGEDLGYDAYLDEGQDYEDGGEDDDDEEGDFDEEEDEEEEDYDME